MTTLQEGKKLWKKCRELDNKLAEAEAMLRSIDRQITVMKEVAQFLTNLGYRNMTEEDEREWQEQGKKESEEDEYRKALGESGQGC